MTNWYYARGEERMGPVDDTMMAELVASGTVAPDTLVWKEGMADWQAHGTLATSVPSDTIDSDLPASLFGEHAAHACAECGRGFSTDDMVSYEDVWICADCKDVFFQRIREGGAILGQMQYGGFWIRFVARIVDGVILGVFNGIFGAAQGAVLGSGVSRDGTTEGIIILIAWIFSFALGVTYETYFVGKYAATPGKMVCGLKVVMSDGGRVSYGRACGRYFATFLSTLTLLIGYIMAAFDSQKRALHDHICDTRVIRK